MALIPPQPTGSLPGSSYWNDWIEKLRVLINSLSTGGLSHLLLGGVQGGNSTEQFHLTNSQHAAATAARDSRGNDTTDDIIIDLATKGLVLKDTQGTPHYWRVTISNVGALVTTDLGTTKP